MANRGRAARCGSCLPRLLLPLVIPFSQILLRYFTRPFAIRYSLFATRFFHSLPPREGRAERRWRSDACEAPVSARHTRSRKTRVNALLTDAQTPHRLAQTGKTRLAFIAHPGRARPAIDLRKPDKQARPAEASCVPCEGTLAFRRSTWDFWPGPVLAVVPPSLKLRRASPPELTASTGTARLKPLSKAFRGGAAVPPGSCGNLICRTGHRYPEEQVSRASPVRPLTASGDTTAPLRLTGSPLEDAPQERG
jgi:hypothetical protein